MKCCRGTFRDTEDYANSQNGVVMKINRIGCKDGSLAKQAGLGLPAAIFVITLLSVIVVGVNYLVSGNSRSFQNEINLTRAFYAAESGAGFVLNGIYPPEEYSSYSGSVCAGSGSPVTYEFENAGLGYCTAEVTCEPITIGSDNYLTVESTGTCDEVSRTVQVRTAY